jgi:hypothetical protein
VFKRNPRPSDFVHPTDRRIVYPDITEEHNVQIVVFQRGYVFVGVVSKVPFDENSKNHWYKQYQIDHAYSILSWGSARGLGDLVNGPLPDTQLEPKHIVRLHELSSVAAMDVSWKGWRELLMKPME